jgi:hypothetical protein
MQVLRHDCSRSWLHWGIDFPPLKRWAIGSCPSGAFRGPTLPLRNVPESYFEVFSEVSFFFNSPFS